MQPELMVNAASWRKITGAEPQREEDIIIRKNILGTAILATVLVSGALSVYSGSPRETAAADTTAATAGTQAADSKEEGTTATEAETTQASAELKEIAVGANPAPHAEILNTAKEVLASKDYELKIVEYTDYVQPNNTLDSGDLDANYFQHKSYLGFFDTQSGAELVGADAIHYESFGIYADKTAPLEELPGETTVLIPSDVSNEARALLLLEAQGLIKLRDGVGLGTTKNDIMENTRNLDIVELEAAQLPRSISDGDIAVIDDDYAIEVGFKVSDALAIEDSQPLTATTYDNVVAAREGEESNGATKTLVGASTSPEVKQFMEEAHEGAVVPLF